MNVRKAKHGWIFTLVFTLISIAYVFPIALVVINSFKKKAYISKKPFAIPTDKMFVGIETISRESREPALLTRSLPLSLLRCCLLA